MALQVQIEKEFDGFKLDVDFEMDGGCMGILGASGCGKSMTLKCIAGIEKPDSGKIVLNGRTLFDSEKRINLSVQERKIGYLFQNYALFPTMTVEQNLSIVLFENNKNKRKVIEQKMKQFHLEGLEQRYPSQLSGGQQQRVALARMLLYQPEIIMLDEPFSALDGFLKDTIQMDMLELLGRYQKDVLLVSHSRDEIYRFCNQMILLAKGSSILQGNTAEVFARPQKMEAAQLTGCKNISPAEKIGDYEVYAKAWGIHLRTEEKVEDGIRYIGIRGHNVQPSWNGEKENTMAVTMRGRAQTTFEWQYLFVNAEYEECEKIWWIHEKNGHKKGEISEFPPYMAFPKESLLMLF